MQPNDRDDALRLAREAGFLSNAYLRNNQPYIHDADGIDITDELERFYKLCRDKFVGKDWRQQAYIYLGYMRDRMSSQDVEVVQDFLGPLISTAPENEPAPTEGATPDEEPSDSWSGDAFCVSAEGYMNVRRQRNELRERVKELERDAERLYVEEKQVGDFWLHAKDLSGNCWSINLGRYKAGSLPFRVLGSALGNTDGGSNG